MLTVARISLTSADDMVFTLLARVTVLLILLRGFRDGVPGFGWESEGKKKEEEEKEEKEELVVEVEVEVEVLAREEEEEEIEEGEGESFEEAIEEEWVVL